MRFFRAPGSVRVSLESAKGLCPGDMLVGSVEITNTKKIKARELLLHISASALSITMRPKTEFPQSKMYLHRHFDVARISIFEPSTETSTMVLPPGQHVFPFSYRLPGYLYPSSAIRKDPKLPSSAWYSQSIKYSAKAELIQKTSFKANLTAMAPFQVEQRRHRNQRKQ